MKGQYRGNMPYSTGMSTEEIRQERERSGWNPYAGEEEMWSEYTSMPGPMEQPMMPGPMEQPMMPGPMEQPMMPSPMEPSMMPRTMEQPMMAGPEVKSMDPQLVQPYFMHPDYSQVLEEQRAMEQDLRKLQSMYPQAARRLLPYIEEECDKMEYEGSAMYDLYPDQTTIQNIQDRIYDQVKDQFDVEEPEGPEDIVSLQYRRPQRDPRGKNWLDYLIRVLLLQEMHHRRCRHSGCRRWR